MTNRTIIATDAAPGAIGTYNQAIRSGNTVYMSGQIPLDPDTMELIDGNFRARAVQVFKNLEAVANAAGGSLSQAVKINVFLTDLANFATVNEVMTELLSEPYPARAAVQVAALPKGTDIEADAILVL
ncbi:MAG: RidA family protein [Pseudomonadota bacterium]